MLRGKENIGNTKEFTQSLMDEFDFFFFKKKSMSLKLKEDGVYSRERCKEIKIFDILIAKKIYFPAQKGLSWVLKQ